MPSEMQLEHRNCPNKNPKHVKDHGWWQTGVRDACDHFPKQKEVLIKKAEAPFLMGELYWGEIALGFIALSKGKKVAYVRKHFPDTWWTSAGLWLDILQRKPWSEVEKAA